MIADALSRTEIDVNIAENRSRNATYGETIHSAQENWEQEIFISEKPLNDFNIQTIFKEADQSNIKVEVPFKNPSKLGVPFMNPISTKS